MRRRQTVLLALVLAAVLMACGGLVASTFVKSPQDAAAEARPPVPSVITVPVAREVLRATVVLRGVVAPGRTVEVTAVAPAETTRSVVSAPPLKAGQRVEPGGVVVVVSGRPIIALRGRVPAYRDLRDGFRGPDVVQLQRALRELGHRIGDAEGVYGPSTQEAVRRLYADRGFQPVTEQAEPTEPAKPKGKPGKPRTTVILPSGEVQFVPGFPARVVEVKARLGAEAEGVLMKLATGELTVKGSLSPVDRELVRVGKPVRILAEELDLSFAGKVTSVGAFTEGGEEMEPGHPVVVRGVRPLPERLAGQNVRLTITAAATEGPVLVVPTSAVYAVADGSTQVVRVGPDGRRTRVTVTVGVTAAGLAEVEGDGLAEGDHVVVGETR
ncbi:peptidoglycan-binding protein [Actinocorallia sp. API 0066]|uniref:peptidoglycan-binding domain-containing protein n=1 Tax=Actinocorallia sp. API 0066 TaxID=2896846 RepID=UPI001E4D6C38|nr:peptidoglycan-binding domain-containing protein [Actinocorallia sp. API 0066]MCD0450541.1 peptidoglycan-binding protein [Actinocorallia sp. API 0066]